VPSKKDYERIFNQLWGVDVKWSKLTKEELAQLAAIWSDPYIIARKLGLKVISEDESPRDLLLRAAFEWLKKWEGPVARLVKELATEGQAVESQK